MRRKGHLSSMMLMLMLHQRHKQVSSEDSSSRRYYFHHVSSTRGYVMPRDILSLGDLVSQDGARLLSLEFH